jgi:hypothetical protein
MDIGFRSPVTVRLQGEPRYALASTALAAPAALLLLAGRSPPRRRALPGSASAVLASAFSYRF